MSDYTSRLAPLAGNDLPTYQDPISKGIGNFLVRSAADIGQPILDMYNAPSFGKFFEAAGPAMVAAASPVAAEGKVATKAAGEALETILGRAEQWATPEVKPQGILAYHGSPYDFEKFDTSKIGTGEGAQAYGHGLYFAGNPEVADLYSRVISAGKQSWTGTPKALATEQASSVPDQLRGQLEASWQNNGPELARNLAKRMFEQSRGEPYSDALHYLAHEADWAPTGKRYEVAINADPEHFLDWDKPLSEQSEHVRNALAQAGITSGMTGREIYSEELPLLTGKYNQTDRLRDAGIPGIKYLDQGSRGVVEGGLVLPREGGKFGVYDKYGQLRSEHATEAEANKALQGTHNYVVFDDKTVNILRKYGLAGLLSGAAADAAFQGKEQP